MRVTEPADQEWRLNCWGKGTSCASGVQEGPLQSCLTQSLSTRISISVADIGQATFQVYKKVLVVLPFVALVQEKADIAQIGVSTIVKIHISGVQEGACGAALCGPGPGES